MTIEYRLLVNGIVSDINITIPFTKTGLNPETSYLLQIERLNCGLVVGKSNIVNVTTNEVITDPILSYFQNTGVDGAYYTTWDKSTLFQDAEGMIPVEQMGDPVGRISDVSGNNKHLKQAISSRRGTWQGDHILFDGVDDHYRTELGAFALDGRQIQLWCMLDKNAGAAQILYWPPNPTTHSGPWGTHGMSSSATGQDRREYFVQRSSLAATAPDGDSNGIKLHRSDTLQGTYTVNENINTSAIRLGTTTYSEPLPLILGANAAGGQVLSGKFFGAVVIIDANGATGADREMITAVIAARGGLTI